MKENGIFLIKANNYCNKKNESNLNNDIREKTSEINENVVSEIESEEQQQYNKQQQKIGEQILRVENNTDMKNFINNDSQNNAYITDFNEVSLKDTSYSYSESGISSSISESSISCENMPSIKAKKIGLMFNANYLPDETGKKFFHRGEKYSLEDASASFNRNSIPTRVILSWSNLSIKVKKRSIIDRICSVVCQNKIEKYETILDNVKGIVQPGEMLALMGSSGSGKTSLLNALNYSVHDPLKVYGKIFINGAEADSTRMKIVSCYIQQEDLFFGTLTVKEHLTFHVRFFFFFL